MASCCFSVSGTFGPPAETMMASNGACSGRPLVPSATDDLGIGVAETREPLARLVGQLLVALDGEDLAGDAAQHRRRVARAGADLEHLVAGPKLQRARSCGRRCKAARWSGPPRSAAPNPHRRTPPDAPARTPRAAPRPWRQAPSGSPMPRASRCRATMMARSRACRSGRPASLALEGAMAAKLLERPVVQP